MKKLFSLVISVMTLLFSGCEENAPEKQTGIGVFSVGEGKTVTFSKGNLQYTQSTNTWSFAENQWDIIGMDNVTGGSVSSDPTYGDSRDGDALADKIDLFGWSTGATNFGVSTSEDSDDYSGSFVDWGTNRIGNYAPNTWRTLTYDEWYYLRHTRTNASSLCGVAQVNGVNGLVFLPDSWTCPEGITFKSGFHSNNGVDYYAVYQTFTAAEWSKLESAGAVFLPAAGERIGSSVYSVQRYGLYWSVTEDLSSDAGCFHFDSKRANVGIYGRYTGLPVRLVKDIEGGTMTPDTPTEPENPDNPSASIDAFSVATDKQVTFSKGNLQYHPANNKWRFAENQTDYIGNANSNISSINYGSSYNGWLDLFGWSTSETYFGVSTSTDYSNYSGSFVDWGTNKIDNDVPNTWRTLNYDEWHYLLLERPNYSSLCGVAQVDGANGLILLPDSWTCPADVTFQSGFHIDFGSDYYAAYQTFTAKQWSKLESAGAVFLPAAGMRWGTSISSVHGYGFYWSATRYDSGRAFDLVFDPTEAYMSNNHYRDTGRSVRLVKDL